MAVVSAFYAKVQRKVQGARTSLARGAQQSWRFCGAGRRSLESSSGSCCGPCDTCLPVTTRRGTASFWPACTPRSCWVLSTLKDLVGQVGHQLVLHLPRIQEVLLAIVAHVFSWAGRVKCLVRRRARR